MNYGMTNLTKRGTKTLMHAGQRKITKLFMDIKIMQKLTQRVNLLITIKLPMLLFMIPNHWMIY